MKTKSPECWATESQARALHVEISAERSLLLPYNEFLFSELTANGREQSLRLVFATHEVVVHGHSLRRIETAIQRTELSSVHALPANQKTSVPDGQPVILEIRVTEMEGS